MCAARTPRQGTPRVPLKKLLEQPAQGEMQKQGRAMGALPRPAFPWKSVAVTHVPVEPACSRPVPGKPRVAEPQGPAALLAGAASCPVTFAVWFCQARRCSPHRPGRASHLAIRNLPPSLCV